MPLIATRGASSVQGFGQFAQASAPVYVEDVFNTFPWIGTGGQAGPFVTGIDLVNKGGLLWTKQRETGYAYNHYLMDTVRGNGSILTTNNTAAAVSSPVCVNFYDNGFKDNFSYGGGINVVSWTFREQPKFFDIVTWTGNGSAGREIAHNLGSTPGCIIVKSSSYAGTNWAVYHRSLTSNQYAVQLNNTGAQLLKTAYWNSTTPTSTVFTLGNDADVNESGQTYVAYLFAHDAGGFGLTGTDNVISCGSYTGTSAVGNAQTLGYEPQWILVKNITTAGYDWTLIDTMRGWATNGADAELYANSTSAEYFADNLIDVTATGFNFSVSGATALNTSGATYIYIAIRRGPMKVPTLGTSVFEPAAYTGNGTNPRTVGTLQVTDLAINMNRSGAGDVPLWIDRLRGPEVYLRSSGTGAESSGLTGWLLGQSGQTINGVRNTSPTTYIDWLLRRSPSFFDVVCYTGTGVARTVAHNLGAVPELMIVRSRSAASNWEVYAAPLGATKYLRLDLNSAVGTYSDFWNDTAPTASVFTVATDADVNGSGRTQIAYLFATCAGVSKVGSYTGTGTTLQINCGFTAGARFVLIKRTDSTGDWYVWDSARGIIAGNDPYLLLNSTAAEVTGTDYVDTYSAGFELSSTAPAAINASAGTFIFLAIA